MPNHSISALEASLREETMILDAALEDVQYYSQMAGMRKKDAERARNHISDLEETIAELRLTELKEGKP